MLAQDFPFVDQTQPLVVTGVTANVGYAVGATEAPCTHS